MPPSARKSSLGISARQKALQPHRPYRGDNPEVGKKTGIAVRHVERKSDGFEPFDQLLKQADTRTPPKMKGAVKKRKFSVPQRNDPDEDDEDGEMSMEIDSPLPYLAHARAAVSPRVPRQSTTSMRAISRNSHVDFDEVPSPRPSKTPRKSVAASHASSSTPRSNFANTRNAGPGPSNLSRTLREADSESDNEPAGDFDGGGGYGNDYDMGDDYEQEEDQQETPRRRSFAAMDVDHGDDQDEEEEEEEEEAPPPVSVKSAKSSKTTSTAQPKSKQQKNLETIPEPEYEQSDSGNEEEDVQRQVEQSEEEEEEEDREPTPKPKPKKVKVIEKKNPTKLSVGSRSKKENRSVREGVRRSARESYKPLDWWRGEKLVYGKPEPGTNSAPILVPHIREILRIPKEVAKPLGKRKRGGATRARSKSRTVDERTLEEATAAAKAAMNPEEGWDDNTDTQGIVLDFESKEKVQRRIAFTASMIDPRPIANQEWSFQKIFGDGEFIAAGQLLIPPHVRKPSKGAKDNTYIFYVIEGAINLKVNDTSLVLCAGGMFMVPRGNSYFIENICDRDVKIFFTQARKVPMEPEEGRSSAAPISVVRPGSNVVKTLPIQKAPGSTRAVTEGPAKKEKEKGGGGEKSTEKEGAKGKRANSSRI
ncbi:hypothetical protein BDN72DRAFT_826706 [Pluteus cervinus]|uniref:Uncharacterized protein n=1 Tax=Pluteus cervinus TaxID=181527 RepID=A0ACD3ACW0_9AGAR|nr:hypothetical protein BDN72DRAFT_826706 [Pluteus cervinus]